MASKDNKAMLEKTRNSFAIRFSQSELAVLNKLMEDDEWTNRSGFIKYKIFGDSEEYRYKKMLESGEQKDIVNVMTSLMSEMNRQIDYINFRFDNELMDFKKSCGQIDTIEVRKWVSFIEEWKSQIQKKTDEIFFDCQTILRAINIQTQRKDYKNVESLPDHVLDKAAEDWNDTTSPMVIERARRIMEKFYEENPEIAATKASGRNKEKSR